ncbi:hypothetical protein LBMAG48_14570 [Phycisphaerae bacterium]|nr:hypothetical protein LBMAG48_14570 [Phycisphaerae bacterium]
MGKRKLLSHKKYLAFAEATAKGIPTRGVKAETCRAMFSDVVQSIEREYDSVPIKSKGSRDDCWLLLVLGGAIQGEGLVVGMGYNHRRSLQAMIDVCSRHGLAKGERVLRDFHERINMPRLSRDRLSMYHEEPQLVKLLGRLQEEAHRIEVCTKHWSQPLIRMMMTDPAAFFEVAPKAVRHKSKR